jgi:GT2 family glycosyltransferase
MAIAAHWISSHPGSGRDNDRSSGNRSPWGSTMPPEISVIIPNWNGRTYLEKCLGSLRNQGFSDFEVVVVDNGSTDGSVEFLHRHFPETKIILFGENKGFSKAVNEGIKQAKGDYVLLLNNDVEVDPGLLGHLYQAITHSQEADFLACRMMDFHQRELIDGAGDGFPRKGKAFRIGHGMKFGPPFDQSRRAFGACAGAGFYKKELFEEVGLFDEDFFAYHEDVDWNFRANLMGYRSFYIPEAVVYHIGSGTTGGRYNELTVFHNARNMIYVIMKNLPTALLFKYLPWVIWGQIESFLRFCVMHGYWRAYFGGLSSAIRGSGNMLKKRKEIQRKKRIPTFELEQLLIASEKERKGKIRPRECIESHGR